MSTKKFALSTSAALFCMLAVAIGAQAFKGGDNAPGASNRGTVPDASVALAKSAPQDQAMAPTF